MDWADEEAAYLVAEIYTNRRGRVLVAGLIAVSLRRARAAGLRVGAEAIRSGKASHPEVASATAHTLDMMADALDRAAAGGGE